MRGLKCILVGRRVARTRSHPELRVRGLKYINSPGGSVFEGVASGSSDAWIEMVMEGWQPTKVELHPELRVRRLWPLLVDNLRGRSAGLDQAGAEL